MAGRNVLVARTVVRDSIILFFIAILFVCFLCNWWVGPKLHIRGWFVDDHSISLPYAGEDTISDGDLIAFMLLLPIFNLLITWIFVDRIYLNNFDHNDMEENNDIEKITGMPLLMQHREAALLTIDYAYEMQHWQQQHLQYQHNIALYYLRQQQSMLKQRTKQKQEQLKRQHQEKQLNSASATELPGVGVGVGDQPIKVSDDSKSHPDLHASGHNNDDDDADEDIRDFQQIQHTFGPGFNFAQPQFNHLVPSLANIAPIPAALSVLSSNTPSTSPSSVFPSFDSLSTLSSLSASSLNQPSFLLHCIPPPPSPPTPDFLTQYKLSIFRQHTAFPFFIAQLMQYGINSASLSSSVTSTLLDAEYDANNSQYGPSDSSLENSSSSPVASSSAIASSIDDLGYSGAQQPGNQSSSFGFQNLFTSSQHPSENHVELISHPSTLHQLPSQIPSPNADISIPIELPATTQGYPVEIPVSPYSLTAANDEPDTTWFHDWGLAPAHQRLIQSSNGPETHWGHWTTQSSKPIWRKLRFAVHQLFIFLLLIMSAVIVTNSLKLMVGRLRPDFISRCRPNYDAPGLVIRSDGWVAPEYHWICQGLEDVTAARAAHVMEDGRMSFPSGHSSYSMTAAVFSSLLLWNRTAHRATRRIGPLIVPFIIIIYLTAALLIATSRSWDNRHHGTDIVSGIIIGTICGLATLCFDIFTPSWERDATLLQVVVDTAHSIHETAPMCYARSQRYLQQQQQSQHVTKLTRSQRRQQQEQRRHNQQELHQKFQTQQELQQQQQKQQQQRYHQQPQQSQEVSQPPVNDHNIHFTSHLPQRQQPLPSAHVPFHEEEEEEEEGEDNAAPSPFQSQLQLSHNRSFHDSPAGRYTDISHYSDDASRFNNHGFSVKHKNNLPIQRFPQPQHHPYDMSPMFRQQHLQTDRRGAAATPNSNAYSKTTPSGDVIVAPPAD